IIDVTDFGTTEEGCAYFAMEHLDGIDLADVLSLERRIEPERAVQIAIQICRALHAAHAAGVIHRDLKPENIFLVAREGQADFVKVLDFGIARSVNRGSRRLTNPGMAMGTPEYMAPEQATGGPADRRSDIFSVGALLYEMLLGMPPQLGTGPLRSLESLETAAAAPPALPRRPREVLPTLPDDLDDVIMRALHRDPTQRYQTMAQLEYDLTKSLWGRPRAVADLLGFRDPARTETPSGSFRRNLALEYPVEEGAAPMLESTGPHPLVSPTPLPGTLAGVARLAGTIDVPPARTAVLMGRSPTPSPPPLAPGPRGLVPAGATAAGTLQLGPARAGRVVSHATGMRVMATMAMLGIVAVAAVMAYQRLPWLRGERSAAPLASASVAAVGRPAPPGVPAAAERAARVAALTTQGSALARRPNFAAADLPALQATMAELAKDGAPGIGQELGRTAAAGLVARAVAAVSAGQREQALALYAVARSLDTEVAQPAVFARSLARRGEAALASGQAGDAVEWARESLRVAESDADAQALLGLALAGSREWAAAVPALELALELRPGDATLRRALGRVRSHLPRAAGDGGETGARPRRRTGARAVAPGDDLQTLKKASDDGSGAEGTGTGDVRREEDLPLAPTEPAAEKQQ
ncbi:MAG TPA: serine/threonine-protein kinase, partial [Polyangia bacterium]|nr:serine/threonine-protein kinase [Polyangia bacterium]